MAISTYSQLKDAVANWANRSDLTDRIPEFIALAEARINRKLRLRTMESNQTLTGSVGSREIALPTDYLEPLVLWLEADTGREQLRFVPADLLLTSPTDGQPEYWTIDGSNIAFERECDQAYSFTFRMLQSFALSDASPTNWLLTNCPDVYLFGARAEVAPYLQDREDVGVWEPRFLQAMEDVNTQQSRGRSGLATLAVDTALRPRPATFNINTGE